LPGLLRRFYRRAHALPVTGYPVTGYPVTGYPVTGYPVTGYPVAGRALGLEALAKCPGHCLLSERLQQLANAHVRGQAGRPGEVGGEKGGIAAAKLTDFALAHGPAGRGQEEEPEQGGQWVARAWPATRARELGEKSA